MRDDILMEFAFEVEGPQWWLQPTGSLWKSQVPCGLDPTCLQAETPASSSYMDCGEHNSHFSITNHIQNSAVLLGRTVGNAMIGEP